MRQRCLQLVIAFGFPLNLLLLPALAVGGPTVNLSWNASKSQVAGYNVYRGTTSGGPYTKINASLDTTTNYLDSTVQNGQTYYYVTTSVGVDGDESKYSNQAEAKIGAGNGQEAPLYSFTGGTDPDLPYAGVILDKAGNLYGTTEFGGAYNQGTVFELTPHADGVWTETVLYSFTGGEDGGQPYASLTFDSAGNLYGTTGSGGGGSCTSGCGTVFKLLSSQGSWTEKVLYAFTGESDGREPYARVIFDSAGNLYGTTLQGGNIGSVCTSGCGTVFKLSSSGGRWTESVLYAFAGDSDGTFPYAGLVFDGAGNLYGTTYAGGSSGSGTVFKLAPSGSSWTESVLHTFTGGNDGKYPFGDLIVDAANNLYGTAFEGGAHQYGLLFELLPRQQGQWKERVIHGFHDAPAANPIAGLIMDSSGILYGSTMSSSEGSCQNGCGTLFKLTPGAAGGWTYTLLHVFGRGTDGYHPSGDLILDAAGNLYGTTQAGGANGSGTVFELTK